MPQSLAQIYIHLVFSTKGREPWLGKSHRALLHAYLAGICRDLDAPALKVGGVSDHIHLLCRFPRTLTIAKWVETLKSNSSRWYKAESVTRDRGGFAWQKGYGAFSVSPSHVEAVIGYIDHQEEHHRTETFQDEFRRFLHKYEIDFDERYVWD